MTAAIHKRPTPLITRLPSIVLSIAVALVWVAAVAIVNVQQRDALELLKKQQYATVSLLAERIDQSLQAYQAALTAFAAQVPAEILDQPDRLDAYLAAQRGLSAFFDDALVIFSTSGVILADYPPLRRGFDASGREYLQRTLGLQRSVVSEPFLASFTGVPVVVMTAPLVSPQGKLLAIAGGGLDLGGPNFLGRIARTRIGDSGYLFLTTRNRLMLSHPNPALAMQPLPPVGAYPLIDRVVDGFVGSEVAVSPSGVPTLYSFAAVPTGSWVLAAGFPLDEALGPVRDLRRQIFLIAAALSLLSLALAGIARRWILDLNDSQSRYASLSKLSSDWIWEQDAQLNFVRMSGDPLPDIGLDLTRYLGKPLAGLPLAPAGVAAQREYESAVEAQRPFYDLELRAEGPDGREAYLALSGEPFFDARGRFAGYRGVGSDITRRKQAEITTREATEQLEQRVRDRTGELIDANHALAQEVAERRRAEKALLESQSRLSLAVEASGIGLWDWDIEGDGIEHVQPSGSHGDPRPLEQLLGRVHPDDIERVRENILNYLADSHGKRLENEYRYQRMDGKYAWALSRGRVHVWGENGKPRRMIGTVQDITALKAAEQRVAHLAHYDALTDLPNRVLFYDRLSQAIQRAERLQERLALMFIDLDHFKNINDSLGHDAGDLLLKEVAGRLQSVLRESDTLSRQGGDEFLLLLPDLQHGEDAAPVAEKLLAVFAEPFRLDGRELHVTPSIGIALYPEDGGTESELIKHADIAMYHSKTAGRNAYHFFAAQMDRRVAEIISISNDLRSAIDKGQFHLVYQPKTDVGSGRLTGCEALLRWQHPERGPISPGLFIPIAEDSGQIAVIGDWVLAQVIEQQARWRDAGLPVLPVAVNLSARQLRNPELPARIRALLATHGMTAESLDLEVTESSLADQAEPVLEALRELGCGLAIDDFGTGYSNLAYLKRFRIDSLKIDQTFVRDISTDPDDAAIVRALIGLAKSMGMRVIAEGVETEEQLEFLRFHGCDEVQGYYFGKPLAPEEFERRLGLL